MSKYYESFNIINLNLNSDNLTALRNIKIRGWGQNYLNNIFNNIRLFLPQLLDKLNKIIYLDIDTLVLGDINELFELLPNDKIIGVVQTIDCYYSKWVSKMYRKKYQLAKNELLFNAGMYVTHLDWWRENNITDKLINLISLNNNKETKTSTKCWHVA